MTVIITVKYILKRKKKVFVQKLAHDYCLKNDLPWHGKIRVYRWGKYWIVMTNRYNKGDGVAVVIDDETEEIVEVGINTP